MHKALCCHLNKYYFIYIHNNLSRINTPYFSDTKLTLFREFESLALCWLANELLCARGLQSGEASDQNLWPPVHTTQSLLISSGIKSVSEPGKQQEEGREFPAGGNGDAGLITND